jgi:hypothetical protein
MNTTTAEGKRTLSPGLILLLAVGDALALLAFAALGRASHHLRGDNPLLGVLMTAAPFLVAWGVVAPLTMAFGRGARALATLPRWLVHTAVTWAIAGPLGLALRSLWLKRPIAPTFAAVTMATVLVIMGAWRGAFWWVRRKR